MQECNTDKNKILNDEFTLLYYEYILEFRKISVPCSFKENSNIIGSAGHDDQTKYYSIIFSL